MKVVLKQSTPVENCRRFCFHLPEGAKPVAAAVDPNNSKLLSVWYITEQGKQANLLTYFSTVATGEAVPSNAVYIDSLIVENLYIFHVWQITS